MAFKSVWCCLIIGILLSVSQVECRRRRLLTRIIDAIADSNKHIKYRYEVQNSVYDFPQGLGRNVTLDNDFTTDCHTFIESKLCSGALAVCMSNGTIMCTANPSNSRPCPAADCVIFKDKQCNSPSCEKTFPCLVRLRKLVKDPNTNKKVDDPAPHEKGLCVTLVAKPARIRKS